MHALVLCGDIFHNGEAVRAGLRPLEQNGFEFEFVEKMVEINSLFQKQSGLIILAKANVISKKNQKPWLDQKSAALFREYIRKGNGLLVMHSGTVGYKSLHPVHQTIGGEFLEHPAECDMIIKSTTNHPITEGILPFNVRDEQYFVSVEDDARTFLISHSKHGICPAGWIRHEGNGRVCALTPGHNIQVWQHPSFQKILVGALLWLSKSQAI